ncbi:hypothetical protein [Flagellimonas pacifica]|uniref:General secretion pathway protein n=1 Tax=Flagellimonas pacifica TaxID=1247520 RepID=A0A285MWX0_9FLAO|nr:hypothetical protein [Allomuricauda parva]SNZ01700.1 hypothetical protein SAMN06265377_3542 [Allomuricauda parva]
MFEKYSYKQKFLGLVALLLVLFLAANKRSFKVTKNAYGQMREIREKLEFMQNSNHDSRELQRQMDLYDNLIGKQDIQPDMAQQSILDFATKYDDIEIDELSETHFSNTKGFDVITNRLTLEGSYSALAKVVYDYEKNFKVSSLVGVSFIREKNYNRRKNKLKVLLIFQNYEKSI